MDYRIDIRLTVKDEDLARAAYLDFRDVLLSLSKRDISNVLGELTVWNTNTGKWEYVAE